MNKRMRQGRWIFGAGAAALCASIAVHGLNASVEPTPAFGPAPPVSILTYNVHGLPWPLASGRDAAFEAIGERLRGLRARGAQPHIVVLQEAFTDAAKRIAVDAGYDYVAIGPSAAARSAVPASPADRSFEAGGSWTKGEGIGKFEDSGLMILSDYPIVKVRKLAYPDFACAGFDCLANKGALLAAVRVPGLDSPLQVVTTHLVSRFETDVPDSRNFYAYRREVETLAGFLRANADPRAPVVLAGDFNVGVAPGRRAALTEAVARAWQSSGYAAPADALRSCAALGSACPGARSADAALSLRRARDWQFFTAGPGARLEVSGIRVLFGREPGGTMLSDHVGYEADYRLARPARA